MEGRDLLSNRHQRATLMANTLAAAALNSKTTPFEAPVSLAKNNGHDPDS